MLSKKYSLFVLFFNQKTVLKNGNKHVLKESILLKKKEKEKENENGASGSPPKKKKRKERLVEVFGGDLQVKICPQTIENLVIFFGDGKVWKQRVYCFVNYPYGFFFLLFKLSMPIDLPFQVGIWLLGLSYAIIISFNTWVLIIFYFYFGGK